MTHLFNHISDEEAVNNEKHNFEAKTKIEAASID